MSDDWEAPSPWRKWAVFILLTIFVGAPLALAGWAWLTLRFVYSTGDRAGYVQKISKKGWLCKTWEGELAMVNLPGAMPEIFTFTVRDEAVAQQLVKTVGQRVALTYEQHVGIPTTCFGDTQYFITKVVPVGDNAVPGTPAAPQPATPPGKSPKGTAPAPS